MKNFRLISRVILLTLWVGLASCAKDPEISNNEKEGNLIPVSFNVGFSKEVTDFRSTSISGQISSRAGGDITITKLYYLVYDAVTGEIYKSLEKSNFSEKLSDELPEGEYYVIFIGSMYDEEWPNELIGMEKDNRLISSVFPSPDEGKMLPDNAWLYWEGQWGAHTVPFFCIRNKFKKGGDLFYAKYNLIVEEGATIEEEIVLNRIVGKVEVVIEDAIPENIESISFSGNDIPSSFLYNTTGEIVTVGDWDNKVQIESSKVGTTGYTISFISFENCDANQTYYPFSLTLTVRKTLPEGVIDKGQSIIAEKTISGVNVIKNKTVIYRGNLFDGMTEPSRESETSFNLLVNNEWDSTIELDFSGNPL